MNALQEAAADRQMKSGAAQFLKYEREEHGLSDEDLRRLDRPHFLAAKEEYFRSHPDAPRVHRLAHAHKDASGEWQYPKWAKYVSILRWGEGPLETVHRTKEAADASGQHLARFNMYGTRKTVKI
jgi:hypothetical protein